MKTHLTTLGPGGNLQTLKGLACLLVVAYHVVGSGPGWGLDLPKSSLLVQYSEAISLLRMPLFTFLSGWVYSLRPVESGSYMAFIRKKFSRLYVPMVVVGLLFLGLSMLAPGVNNRPQAADALSLFVYPYAHLWFVQALIAILAVVGIAEILGLLATPQRYALVLLGTIAVQLFGSPEVEFFSLGRASYLLPFFVLGIGVQRYASSRQWSESLEVLLWLLFGGTLALHVAGITGAYGAPLEQRSFLALLLSCSGLLVLCRYVGRSRALEFIGGYAFTIYLFHIIFTSGMREFAAMAGIGNVPLLFVLGLTAGLLGPIAFEHVMKWTPPLIQRVVLGARLKKVPTTPG